MKMLYVGDVMGEPGIRVVEKVLPGLVAEHGINVVIAQAENVSEGKGITPADYARLKQAGIHMFSGGNWSLYRPESHDLLTNPNEPIVRPANYPIGTPGLGSKYLSTQAGKVLLISVMGQIVGRDAEKPIDNPLVVIDAILEREKGVVKAATFVNIHGDFSSEKVVLGYYLDGRVTAVVGDHWHVPTADAMVLPNGTAHQTDVGMCGILHASLGVRLDSIIPRWRDGKQTPNVLESSGPLQFNALLVEADEKGLALKAEAINQVIEDAPQA